MNHTSLLSLLTVGAVSTASAQVTVLLETFGTPSSTTAIESYTGYDNTGLTFFGTGDVRTSSASSGYDGASGGGNVFINTTNEYFEMGGMDLSVYTEPFLVFGGYEGISDQAGVDPTVLKVEYTSNNGSSWDELDYTGPGAEGWGIAFSATASLPNTTTGIKFTNINASNRTIRLDDVQILGGALGLIPESSSLILLAGLTTLGLAINRRRRG